MGGREGVVGVSGREEAVGWGKWEGGSGWLGKWEGGSGWLGKWEGGRREGAGGLVSGREQGGRERVVG